MQKLNLVDLDSLLRQAIVIKYDLFGSVKQTESSVA